MLRVYYSNRTEELLRALVDCVEATRRSVFEPLHLVVPNWNMDVYVRLGLARSTGICAHVETRTLRRFLDETSGRPEAESRTFDGILTALFDEAVLAEPDLAPVAAYLGIGDGDEEGPSVDRRRVQLALALRRLFRSYEVSRPEVFDCWRAGLRVEDRARREAEAWQRRIWMHAQSVSEHATGADVGAVSSSPTAGPAHLFGVPYIARSDAEALARLAADRDVFIYTLNPCQEIWEAFQEPSQWSRSGTAMGKDVSPSSISSRENRRYERRGRALGPAEVFSVENPFRLSNPGELLPLRLWGRPPRESLRLLNAVSACELVPAVATPRGNSLLNTLQRDITLRRSDRESAPQAHDFEGDASIVFSRCASRRRELEAVAAEIWSLVGEDDSRGPGPGADASGVPGADASPREPLRFHEIAVLLVPSEADHYQPLVASVFSEMQDIPFNIVDLPIRGESRLAEAASLLLELPLGRFGREEVLRFVTHPVVAGSFPDADPGAWIRACERLGIYRGADRRDRKDSYVEKDLFNWEQGLTRLALGVFAPDGSVFRRGGESYLASGTSLDDSRGLGRFALLVRSLLADAREAARVQMTLPAWADFLGAFLSTYLKPSTEADQNVLDRCLGAVGALAATPLGHRKVRFAAAYELVANGVAALSGKRGAYLTDGVVVSSFLPMRAIPFKVIFVVGLGERAFPARDRDDDLDLGRAARRAGDVSPREADKYLFLETLLSARERFYLSYVSRDETTGDTLSPSSLVLELQETLLSSYVTAENLCSRTEPPRRHEDARTVKCSPAALAERNAWVVGREIREHVGARSMPPLARLPEGLRRLLRVVVPPVTRTMRPAPAQAQAQAQAQAPAPAEASRARARGRSIERPLSLGSLRRFLECPLQGSARFALRLRETEDEDRLWRDEEPLAMTPLLRATLLRDTLAEGGGDAVYRRLRQTYELEGRAPTGELGLAEARQHLELLRRYREGLETIAAGSLVAVRRSSPPAPLVLDAGSRVFELHAARELELVIGGRASTVRFVAQSPSRFHPRRESLRGFLRHLFAAASAPEESAEAAADAVATELFVLNARRGALVVECFRFDPISRDEACSYLTSLAAEMLDEVHPYLLPCESVFGPDDQADGLDPSATSSRYGPVSDLDSYRPPLGDLRREIVDRRFGLYFRSCTQEEGVAT